jgi:TonB family protein
VPEPALAEAPPVDTDTPGQGTANVAHCAGCGPGLGLGPDPAGPGTGDGPVRMSEHSIAAPRRISADGLRYPPIAISAGLSGDVEIDCVIGPDGRVRDARLLTGNPVFRRAALDAVRQWIYTEPKLNGRPISVLLTVTVHFRLRDRI